MAKKPSIVHSCRHNVLMCLYCRMGGSHSTSSLKPEVVNDLKNSTAFSHAEICDIYRQFKADCTNNTYEMTLEDFTEMYSKVSIGLYSRIICL